MTTAFSPLKPEASLQTGNGETVTGKKSGSFGDDGVGSVGI